MRSKIIVLAKGQSELRGTKLGSVTDGLAAHLARRHVTGTTVERHLRAAAHFARWLDRSGKRASLSSVRSFLLGHLGRCRCPGRTMRSLVNVRAAVHHLVAVLRAEGRFDEERPRRVPVDIEVERFDDYLRLVRGLAASTRSRRRLDARELLTSVFGRGPVHTNKIGASDISTFVTDRPRPCRPGTLGVITVSIRSYLRFLRMEGRCPEGVAAAVPRVARWRLASIPAHLTADEQHRFLASFNTATRRGKRDRALALCMIILGLRAAEVASLRLTDVDWRDGRLHVPATKTGRSRDLPIPTVVGRALAAYVRYGRPDSASGHLFLRIGVLEGEPMDSAIVRSAVRLGYARASLPARYTGTHRLRHTAATRLVEIGAGVKEIADVLGHASLDSIAIYAKVNLPRLRAVALPWPGRSR